VMDGVRAGLPDTIQVLSVAPVEASFHARLSCTGKRYVYRVQEGRASPFECRYCWAPGLATALDIDSMRRAAALLVGEHHFGAFG
jgi:tRNA pseudouridine38-40 synthase